MNKEIKKTTHILIEHNANEMEIIKSSGDEETKAIGVSAQIQLQIKFGLPKYLEFAEKMTSNYYGLSGIPINFTLTQKLEIQEKAREVQDLLTINHLSSKSQQDIKDALHEENRRGRFFLVGFVVLSC